MTFDAPDPLPRLSISPSADLITEVDCPELQWWFVDPEHDRQRHAVSYEVSTGRRDLVRTLTSTRPADEQRWGPGAVELTVVESRSALGTRPEQEFDFTCRADADRVRWLAVRTRSSDGATSHTDHRDPDFGWADVSPRHIIDDGRHLADATGSLTLGTGSGRGAGTYDVVIDGRCFTCLRVIDHTSGDNEFGEAYLTADGRTVAYRQFRPTGYDADWREWQRDNPSCDTHVIDGTLFFHRDCTGLTHWMLTDTAFTGSTEGW